ncbi:uncharacterized protein LOC135688974 isoform X2 [Rhopilema esculentum]|uniref:uncharacterized protein LOC135688974 isoform X2 n=1 Tax=Rhopilema esculentum TaxID=499914 RepID=UPI0031CF8EA1
MRAVPLLVFVALGTFAFAFGADETVTEVEAKEAKVQEADLEEGNLNENTVNEAEDETETEDETEAQDEYDSMSDTHAENINSFSDSEEEHELKESDASNPGAEMDAHPTPGRRRIHRRRF